MKANRHHTPIKSQNIDFIEMTIFRAIFKDALHFVEDKAMQDSFSAGLFPWALYQLDG